MPYPYAAPDTTTITDSTSQATVHADRHNKISEALAFLLAELGSNPRGTSTSLTARLTAIETALGGSGPVNPSTGPDVTAVPAGYTQYYLEEFNSPTAWLKPTGPWAAYDSHIQNGTSSRSMAANISVDTTAGMLRMSTLAQTSGTQLYGSSYIGTNTGVGGGTDAQSYFPLEGYYEFMVRYPMAHSIWNSLWLNYHGSAGWSSTYGYEIDFFEMFTAQMPGRVTCQVHQDFLGAANGYGNNLVTRYPARSTWAIPSSSSRVWSGVTGATHNGQHIDFDNPMAPTGPASGQTGWHLGAVRTYKITGTAGWTLGIDWYIDNKLVLSFKDPCNENVRPYPLWFNPAWGEDDVWDMRVDTWVGGEYIGSSRNAANTTRILTYDGTRNSQAASDNLAAVGQVPDATLWKNNINAKYYLDVSWVRVSVPDGAPPVDPDPPGGATLIFDTTSSMAAATNGASVPNPTTASTSQFYGRFPTTDDANQAITYTTGQSVPGGAKALDHLVNGAAPKYSGAYFRSGTSGLTWPALYARMWFKIAANPTANTYILEFNPQAGGNALSAVRVTTGGKLVMRANVSGTLTDMVTSTTTLAFGTWYSLEMALLNANDIVTVRLCNTTDGDLVEEMTGAYVNTAEPGRVTFGQETSSGTLSTAWHVYTAHHAVATDDWIGAL